MTGLALDTHAFLWLLEGNPKLPLSVRQRIEDPTMDLYLPAIVVTELIDAVYKGRSMLDLPDIPLALKTEKRLSIVAMDGPIAMQTLNFISLPDIHDRCIVATTASFIQSGLDVVLVTRDRMIRNLPFVPTVWE